MDNICKFQYSFFLEGRDSPQIVVRGNNFEEFMLDVEKVKSQFSQVKPAVASPSESGDTIRVCSKHNISMPKQWSTAKQKNYWSHKENGKICFGGGYL